MLRHTPTPTFVRAGHEPNVIPATATALLDCRVLPGFGPEALRTSLLQLVPTRRELPAGV